MISHRVVSRLLAGKELAESEEFIHLSHKFSESVFTTGLITAELPLGPFRPLVGWMLAQYHRITLYRLMKITEPVVAKRMHSGKTSPEQNDSIEWAIKLNSDDKRDSRVVSLEMLHILEAAGGAPGAMMSEMMYQMLIEPSWFSVLQDEIKKVIKADSPLATQLDSLPLMDSFIMETNRMYPVGGGKLTKSACYNNLLT
jgi:cytochrome P450